MAKNLMIQGTMSNAGKSLITAGILRVLKQDGFRAAPFKSQNMALNSFITEDGLEMGRAQVMQAEAAGIPPDVRMNPILLKPTTDVGSQVIVNGEVLGNYPAREYFKMKRGLIPDILKAYDELAKEQDIIVLEGAGSPAEINLKADDIVNMGMAELVDAPVLLAGDIELGGVFAQLYGTVALLEQKERDRIKGLIINKFRGDKSILDPGILMLEERCKKQVVGVLPYISLDIDQEDSLSGQSSSDKKQSYLSIGIIRLPHISNFTDFNPLKAYEAVKLTYVSGIREWKEFDLILLPGTKSTMADLRWLRESGLENCIQKAAAKGTLVMGICGGYQMLGQELVDLEGVETVGGERLRGMNLLPVCTEFQRQKTRTRKRGRFQTVDGPWKAMSHKAVSGYEIHMGVTRAVSDGSHLLTITKLDGSDESQDGFAERNVCGTYLHGIFDEQECTEALLTLLAERKGRSFTENSFDWKQYKEEQYDKLADMIRKNMDMEKIYGIIGLKQEI